MNNTKEGVTPVTPDDVVILWEAFMEGRDNVTKDDVYNAMSRLSPAGRRLAQESIEDIARSNGRRGVTDYTDANRMRRITF